MKILFISHNNHQKKYFSQLVQNIRCRSTVISIPFSLNIFAESKIKNQINLQEILKIKFAEIDLKYRNTLHKKLYKLILKIQTPFLLAGYIKEISRSEADTVAFWNGKKYPQNIGVEITKLLNKQTLFFENGALPDTTAMDFHGLNATASIPKDLNIYKHYCSNATLNTQLTTRKEEKKRIKGELELPENFVFVPFQVGYDTQIIYHSPWIDSMSQLFDMIDEIASKLQIHFVFKEHPSDKKSDYSELHRRADENQYLNFANGVSTPELIQKSKAIVTINSSVGIEGLLYNKKIIVLGEAFYAIEGITKSAGNKEMLENMIVAIDEWELDVSLIKNFLLYLQEEYLVPQSWKHPTQKHFDVVNNKIERFINAETGL